MSIDILPAIKEMLLDIVEDAVEVESIDESTRFRDFELDSMDIGMLIMDVEEKYSLSLDFTKVTQLETFLELTLMIKEEIKK